MITELSKLTIHFLLLSIGFIPCVAYKVEITRTCSYISSKIYRFTESTEEHRVWATQKRVYQLSTATVSTDILIFINIQVAWFRNKSKQGHFQDKLLHMIIPSTEWKMDYFSHCYASCTCNTHNNFTLPEFAEWHAWPNESDQRMAF